MTEVSETLKKTRFRGKFSRTEIGSTKPNSPSKMKYYYTDLWAEKANGCVAGSLRAVVIDTLFKFFFDPGEQRLHRRREAPSSSLLSCGTHSAYQNRNRKTLYWHEIDQGGQVGVGRQRKAALLQFLDQWKRLRFQQTHNQGLCQLFLTVSRDLHLVRHNCPCISGVP